MFVYVSDIHVSVFGVYRQICPCHLYCVASSCVKSRIDAEIKQFRIPARFLSLWDCRTKAACDKWQVGYERCSRAY